MKRTVLSIKAIGAALSRTFNDDPRMPHVCPDCHPRAKAPYFVAYCGDHGVTP